MHCTGSVLTICYICLLIYPYKCGSVYSYRYIVYLMPKLKMELRYDSIRFDLNAGNSRCGHKLVETLDDGRGVDC